MNERTEIADEGRATTHVSERLRDLMNSLEDGRKGLLELSRHLESESTRQFFLRESQVRVEYAAQLERECDSRGHEAPETNGTVAGVLNRVWGDLLSQLGIGDRAALAAAERGEESTKNAYAEALRTELPPDLEGLLLRQQRHILQSHNKVRSLMGAGRKKKTKLTAA